MTGTKTLKYIAEYFFKGMIERIILGALNGIVWGLIISLIALGLSLVFGLIEIVNIAHGELYMLGAVSGYFTYILTNNFWLAIVVAALIIGALGVLVERVVLRPIEGSPINTIICTIGLMFIFQHLGLWIFGGAPIRIEAPITAIINTPIFSYSAYRLVVALISSLTLLGLWLFLHKTKTGLWIRAARQDRDMANSMGIPVDRMFTLTFGLGAALAALGGILAAPITAISYLMGVDIIIFAFVVVIIGGLGSLKGTVVAAILLSVAEGISSVFVNPVEARIISLIVMIVILLFKPQGMFVRVR
jgi:branched-chain amino acid transport system permease protein